MFMHAKFDEEHMKDLLQFTEIENTDKNNVLFIMNPDAEGHPRVYVFENGKGDSLNNQAKVEAFMKDFFADKLTPVIISKPPLQSSCLFRNQRG